MSRAELEQRMADFAAAKEVFHVTLEQAKQAVLDAFVRALKRQELNAKDLIPIVARLFEKQEVLDKVAGRSDDLPELQNYPVKGGEDEQVKSNV